MQEIVHNINLNVSQPNAFEYLHCVQGDHDAEKVIATLYDGNQLYEIGTDCKAMLQGSTESGGLIMQNYLTISEDRHKVEFVIIKEMSSCVGNVTYNIVLSSADGAKKSTFPFIIKNTADITGRTPVSVLTTISDYVDCAEKAAKDSETNKKTTDENVTKATEQATIATNKATESANSAKEATKQANIALTKAEESANSAQKSQDQADIATTKAQEASYSATDSANSATQANESATIASEKASDAASSASSASISATNASKSETNAKTSADSASLSATNASTSETNAQSSATTSSKSAQASATSEANAKQSATNAKASETSASKYASNASISATTAGEKADVATTKATESANSATDSLTYANQSKDYRDQCKSIAQGLEGALLPKGTIAFSELPTKDISTGDMYNISDEFTSDDRFKDGAGKVYTAGTNIYYTSDGLWDVLIGDLEKYAFKTDLEDHVNNKSNPHGVTKAQVGLGNVPNVATNDQTVTYTDSSTLTTLSSGEKMSVAFGKIKKAISDLISHIADTTKHITSSERTLWNTVSGKVDKVDGKGLSTNDYTTTEKNKLNGIESGANKYVHPGSGTNPHGTTKSDVGLGNVGNFKAVSTVASQGLTDTEKSNARTNIGAQAAGSYASSIHNHDTVYSKLGHTHDDRYYTESEIDTKLSAKLDMNTAYGIASCAGSGKYSYCKIATIKISVSYINRPIVFELSGRGRHLSVLTVIFASTDSTDPTLGEFKTNYDNCYYIKKTTTSTWEIYGQYSETWGSLCIHRITGTGADIGVTVNMTNIDALPSGCTQASYGGNVGYASVAASANAVAWENVSGKPSTYSPSSHTHTKSQISDFPSSLPASDVYAWAKASTKPTYTWSEITSKPSSFTPSSHTHSYNDLSNKPTLGSAASKTVRTLSTTGNSGWKDLTTDQGYVPDMAFIALWNGTYNGSASNLAYCNKGAFGTAATANKGDFATAGHTHNYAGSSSAGGSANSLNYFQNTSNTNIGQDTATSNAIGYITDYSGTALTTNVKDGALYRQAYSTKWVHEIYGDYRTGQIALRGKNNGTWQDWRTVLDSGNFSNYAASKSHTHSNYLTSITKAMVTNALGYTPPTSDTNTWRGIQNNLTSDSTSDSLSAAQGKVLKGLIDGKADSTHTHSDYVTKNAASTVNAAITFGKSYTYGIFTSTDNYCSIGSSSAYFYKAYIANIYSKTKVQSPVYYVGDSNNIYFNTTRAMLKDDTYANEMNIDGFSSVVYNNTSRRVVFGFPHKSTAPAEMGIYLYDANNYACGKFYVANGTSGANTSILETGTVKCKSIYNYSGSAPTISDRNKKDHIAAITDELAQQVVEGANPVTYKYKEGTSDRTHYGFIAQDLETLINKLGIDSKDFAPLVKEYQKKDVTDENGEIRTVPDYDAEPTYFIRYEEMIAFLYKYVQNLKIENQQLNNHLTLITSRLDKIENFINE